MKLPGLMLKLLLYLYLEPGVHSDEVLFLAVEIEIVVTIISKLHFIYSDQFLIALKNSYH